MHRTVTVVALLLALLVAFFAPHAASAHGLVPTGMSLQEISAAGDKVCASPPSNFDPPSASAQDIAYYGLPSRPSEAKALTEWEYTVQHAKYRWCGTQLDPTMHFGTIASDSGNWSGYVVKEGGSNTYDAARGWFTLKCASTGHAGIWVGIGGSSTLGGTNYGDALWQAGWDTYKHQFWYEGVGGSINSGGAIYYTSYTTHAPVCGDQGYTIVYNNNSQRYVFVQDLTNGGYATTTFTPHASDVFHSAEWILERPKCNTSGFYRFAGGIGGFTWSGDYWHDIDTQGYPGIGQSSTNYKLRMVDRNSNVLVNTSSLKIDLSTNKSRMFDSTPTGNNGTDYVCS